ncbi:hypothetical protein [Xanthobacter versatilis]|uniref:hypothetical protein n=1 Tax=Xanthobacter autotrophicus (strain ATCC BAA-1158 / Py2) TaxID=78245 RepID=UPI00372CD9C0
MREFLFGIFMNPFRKNVLFTHFPLPLTEAAFVLRYACHDKSALANGLRVAILHHLHRKWISRQGYDDKAQSTHDDGNALSTPKMTRPSQQQSSDKDAQPHFIGALGE